MSTVTVACKLPAGLQIDLPIGAVGETTRVTLKGGNSSGAVGGYGLTHGVDAAGFAAWRTVMKDFEPVAKGLVFAQAKRENAQAQAIDQAGERSGFEGLNPDKPAPGIERVPGTEPKDE